MPKVSVFLLLACAVLFNTRAAFACQGALEGIDACIACGEDIPTSHCGFSFCSGGDSCNTSYGECSCEPHDRYTEASPIGECEGDPGECGDSRTKGDKLSSLSEAPTLERAKHRARRLGQPKDILPMLVLIPSRCTGAYTLVDPTDAGGM